MVKQYIIDTLNLIKEINEKISKLYSLGVDLLELETGISGLENSISVILRKEKDEEYGYIQDLVGWWLYDNVEKTIWDKETTYHLDNIDYFADYLIQNYQK
jgi:hypothetical protein